MNIRKTEFVPVVPPEEHPYMHDLYERTGLELTSEADVVLSAAHKIWSSGTEVTERVEAAELLLGRRIDGQELNTLPLAFSLHIFQPETFEGLLGVVSRIAETEQNQ